MITSVSIQVNLLNSIFLHHLIFVLIESLCLFEIVLGSDAFKASLVVQWLRIHLPMQGTQVRALVREDPTCLRATKPVCHNY